MDPMSGFVGAFVLTLAALSATVATGRAGRVKLHLPCVALSLFALGATVWFAKDLGRLYDLESAGPITPVHLLLARLAAGAYLLPLVSGVMTLRDRRHKRLHLAFALVALALTLAAAVTGTTMLLLAERR